jgi:hypothetical protein
MKRLICLLSILSLGLTGCTLRYEDVSQEPEYAPYIGSRYSLNSDMRISGVATPGKDIDAYTIKPMSIRTSGPEIITEDVLKSGNILTVQGIKRSINHIPGYQSIYATVDVQSYEKEAAVPVVIALKYLQSTNDMQKLEH